MAEPKRLRVLLGLVALIQGMTGVRTWDDVSFTYPNPPKAELGDRDIATPGALYFPWFGVSGGFGSRLQGEGRTTVGVQLQIPDEFHVFVVGQFKKTADADAETWLQRGFEDFRRTVMANTTLGLGVWLREIAFGEYRPDAGALAAQNLAEFEQELIVIIDDRFTVG